MKLERWAHLAEIVASMAVVVTLVFLAVEVRANTLVIERQSYEQRTDRVFEPFLDPSTLPTIYAKVKAVDGMDRSVQAFMDQYDLTPEEATMWSRHLASIWRSMELNFMFDGPSSDLERQIRLFLSTADNQLYWEVTGAPRAPEFRAYVEGIREGM